VEGEQQERDLTREKKGEISSREIDWKGIWTEKTSERDVLREESRAGYDRRRDTGP
jgi:hypothetical protein